MTEAGVAHIESGFGYIAFMTGNQITRCFKAYDTQIFERLYAKHLLEPLNKELVIQSHSAGKVKSIGWTSHFFF